MCQTITLYNHQKIALTHLRMNRSFALFMEQGTGKTIPTILRIQELLSSSQIRNALVVCPKAVIGSWQRDFDKLGVNTERIQVINYDRVWRNGMDKTAWDCIVLDEAHCIKNPHSKRTKALLQMSMRAKFRYILTGTPVSNGQLENLWSEFCFLNPVQVGRYIHSRIWGGSYYKFLDDYCILNQWHQPYKYIHVNQIQKVMDEYSYRVKKVDCLDLPDKLPDEILEVDLKGKSKKLYKGIMKDSALQEYSTVYTNSLSRMTAARTCASGYVKTEEGVVEAPCEKLDVLHDFLSEFEKKLVIFAEYTHSIQNIADLCTKLGKRFVVLNGTQKDKTVWREFQEDPSVRVIICQYQSANAGIDLYAADTMLFYEPTLSSNVLEQCKDRIHRIGQQHKCSYIHILTNGTIEKAIYHALINYRDFTEKMFTEHLEFYRKGGAA